MKELLTNSVSTVSYPIYVNGFPTPADAGVTVSVVDSNGNSVIATTAASLVSGTTSTYSHVLPSSALSEETTLTATWTFAVSSQPQTITDLYSVITQYADWSQFQVNTIYSDFLTAERVARFVINTHCGQEFYKENNTYGVQGKGDDALTLPKPLISLTSIDWPVWDVPHRPGQMTSDDPNSLQWEIVSDGWILRLNRHQTNLDPVYWRDATFKRYTTYNILGQWGWSSVPTQVQEAANILTADLLSDEHKYRDKYLTSVKFGDWRLEFDKTAFETTGNALADSLLTDFRIVPGIGII